VFSDETAVSHAQQALAGDLTALAGALSPGAEAGGGSSAAGAAAAARSRSASASASGAVSAQQLAADQQSADAAADQVTIARQALAGATAVSPITGTVVSVSAVPGAAAAAGTTSFEVAGLDSWQAVAQVPVSDMPQVAVGEAASVLPDGSATQVSATVVGVALMPVAGSNPAAYTITVGLAGQPSGLHDGGYAGVTITTGHTSGVSVPTSAVHYSGSRATVTVDAAGATRAQHVTVGTRGPVMTRITSGLTVGEQVVLANLNAPLPGSNKSAGPPPGRGTFVFVGPAGRRQFQVNEQGAGG
jgi:hypothetical protein